MLMRKHRRTYLLEYIYADSSMYVVLYKRISSATILQGMLLAQLEQINMNSLFVKYIYQAIDLLTVDVYVGKQIS